MARRRRTVRRTGSSDMWWLAAAGLVCVSVVLQAIRQHPLAASLIGIVLLASLGAAGWLWIQRSRRLSRQELSVAVTDLMSGPEFERWVAQLMTASGCRRVRVSGGSGDKGADVTGYAPDGRRLVVQCKRYSTKVGSPEVQRFAGTAHHIHRADVALLVTNNYLTVQAAGIAAQCHITVVDRDVLGRWAATLTLPIASMPGSARSMPAQLARMPIIRRLHGVWPRRTRPNAATLGHASSTLPAAPTSPPPATTSAPPGTSSPSGADWWNEAP
ncbi:restriction endonuclease [Actinoplanes sp. NPDC026670]|uniref:restriction endonuclease n=1 Tax=Actinoplanes sp. NPDC026670 TaxID=3154700 RepID=UPI0033C237AC